MALDLIVFEGLRVVNERSALTITAHFRDRRARASVTPTNVYYRLDAEDGCQIRDWTSVSANADVDVSIASADNSPRQCNIPSEARLLTVMADRGLATQFANYWRYEVRNLPWSR